MLGEIEGYGVYAHRSGILLQYVGQLKMAPQTTLDAQNRFSMIWRIFYDPWIIQRCLQIMHRCPVGPVFFWTFLAPFCSRIDLQLSSICWCHWWGAGFISTSEACTSVTHSWRNMCRQEGDLQRRTTYMCQVYQQTHPPPIPPKCHDEVSLQVVQVTFWMIADRPI